MKVHRLAPTGDQRMTYVFLKIIYMLLVYVYSGIIILFFIMKRINIKLGIVSYIHR